MNIEKNIPVECFKIIDAPGLDPIVVFLETIGESSGRITVVCFGRAWSAYFGAMGKGYTIRRFLSLTDADYVAGKMELQNDKKHDKVYLKRIIDVALRVIKDEI